MLVYILIKFIPTNHIVIYGNTYLSDTDIIRIINYQDYPNLFKYSQSEIINKLHNNPYINKASVKRTLNGNLILNINEAKPLFYNRNKNKLILSNNQEIATDIINGLPILTNYVPDSIYERLLSSMAKINDDTIHLISEIIYEPWKNGDVMIDETRFFLKMNDGNHVYTNLIHFEKLNSYIEIYATLEGKKGTLYLDSSSDKISFSLF